MYTYMYTRIYVIYDTNILHSGNVSYADMLADM